MCNRCLELQRGQVMKMKKRINKYINVENRGSYKNKDDHETMRAHKNQYIKRRRYLNRKDVCIKY